MAGVVGEVIHYCGHYKITEQSVKLAAHKQNRHYFKPCFNDNEKPNQL